MSKRMVALLLALVMLLGLLPAGALAAEPENNSLGTVRVIVENMTAKEGQDPVGRQAGRYGCRDGSR